MSIGQLNHRNNTATCSYDRNRGLSNGAASIKSANTEGFLIFTKPLFLFDGDCGLCQNAIDRIKSRIAPPIDFATYQSVDLDALDVTLATCLEGPVLVRADRSHVVGVGAMAGMLRTARNPYPLFGRAMIAPGISRLLNHLQPVFYRNRHRLPGGTAACRTQQP
ncbi:thiol-disulfide oxidoreductase DCC family protein [Cryobacterium fucosi]|uniref:DUF393 domain-containing protein n=1 Tax=Cryobacterium fucosi TaxID=1259157 RepID=A0A4R9B721_9MICO|nr:DCC1-like thiol-disulfide oxidoreductase family protein [Cryobacterium fucosi]TFD75645.1 DUF393 domain-containing protein [Cryobacterium fucosi]